MNDLEQMGKIVGTIVKNYQTDFEIDKQFMHDNPKAKFIWSVYPSGTAIFQLWSNAELPGKSETVPYLLGRQADREIIVNNELYGLQYVSKDKERKFYIIDQNTESIREITGEEALKTMEKHIEKLKKIWTTS